MQQWDRERILVNETREVVTKEVTERDAINVIIFGREDGVPDEKIRQRLEERFKLTPDKIDELFEMVDAHP